MIQFDLRIEDGKTVIQGNDRRSWDDYVQSRKDGDYVLVLKKKTKPRSDQQRKYLFGVVYKMIGKEAGMTQDEVHDSMKLMFLVELKYVNGKSLKCLRSLSDLGEVETGEMSDYIEHVRAWAVSFLGIVIPDSN